MTRLSKTIQSVNENFRDYVFGEAVRVIYAFWLYDFCDVYLEATKPIFRSGDNEAILET